MEQELISAQQLLVSALQRALVETDATGANRLCISEALRCAQACEFDSRKTHETDLFLLSQAILFLSRADSQAARVEERRALKVAQRALQTALIALDLHWESSRAAAPGGAARWELRG